MSVGNVIDSIQGNLEDAGLAPPPAGRLIERINQAQNRLSLTLRFPLRYIKSVDATTPFELPAEARPTGLEYVEYENQNQKVSMLTVAMANDIGVPWDDSRYPTYQGHPRYGRYLVIYDPVNISAPVTPLGFTTGDTLRLLYSVKPTDVALRTDTLFDGELPEYADELHIQYVTFQLFALREKQLQAQLYLADYKSLLEDAFAATRPHVWLPRARGDQ